VGSHCHLQERDVLMTKETARVLFTTMLTEYENAIDDHEVTNIQEILPIIQALGECALNFVAAVRGS